MHFTTSENEHYDMINKRVNIYRVLLLRNGVRSITMYLNLVKHGLNACKTIKANQLRWQCRTYKLKSLYCIILRYVHTYLAHGSHISERVHAHIERPWTSQFASVGVESESTGVHVTESQVYVCVRTVQSMVQLVVPVGRLVSQLAVQLFERHARGRPSHS